MDEEMEDFIEEFLEPSEIDWDYEFDAAHFYDFTQEEDDSNSEAERWFHIAASYPPSPLIVKLNMAKGIMGDMNASSSSDNTKNVKSNSKNVDIDVGYEVSHSQESCKGTESGTKAKTKSVPRSSKTRSSTLMKPTASHLAKLNKARDSYSSSLTGRSRNSSIRTDQRSFHNSPGFDNGATKRQKLEIGYLRKVAHLKHQALLLHKKSKKVTIPKEPGLETEQRAQNRRSRNNSESSEHAEPKTRTFKARPLNRKILQAPSLLPPKKSTPQLPEFQVFHLKTMQRAMQHLSANELNKRDSNFASQGCATDIKRSNYLNALKEKLPLKNEARSLNNKIFPAKEDIGGTQTTGQEMTIPMETKLAREERLAHNPPTELFNKLSLRSESESNSVYQPKGHLSTKGSKENAPESFHPEFWKCVGKPNQCGSGRGIPGIAYRPNMNRSLDIC